MDYERKYFVQFYLGSGRPTGHVCRNHHVVVPVPGWTVGGYEGRGDSGKTLCVHNDTEGSLWTAADVEADFESAFYAGEHDAGFHEREARPNCPNCSS